MRIVMWHVTLPTTGETEALPLAAPEPAVSHLHHEPDPQPVHLWKSKDVLPAWMERLRQWAGH